MPRIAVKRAYEEPSRADDLAPSAGLPARKGKLTLVCGARDEKHNDAVALKEYLEARMGRAGGARG